MYKTTDSAPQVFIDIEWDHAENSSGNVLSIGAVRSDCDAFVYGQWPLQEEECSQWTLMQVVPQLAPVTNTAPTAVNILQQWRIQEPKAVFWASEKSAAAWLAQQHRLYCQVWPGPRSEHETIQLWWCAQAWLDSNPRYHALWDARGMLAQWEKLHPT